MANATKYIKHGPKVQVIEYDVVGTGPFPLDMLRYDCAWPARTEDVHRVMATRETDPDLFRRARRVTIYGTHEPTVARWNSFTWAVYANRHEADIAVCDSF